MIQHRTLIVCLEEFLPSATPQILQLLVVVLVGDKIFLARPIKRLQHRLDERSDTVLIGLEDILLLINAQLEREKKWKRKIIFLHLMIMKVRMAAA